MDYDYVSRYIFSLYRIISVRLWFKSNFGGSFGFTSCLLFSYYYYYFMYLCWYFMLCL